MFEELNPWWEKEKWEEKGKRLRKYPKGVKILGKNGIFLGF